MLEKMKLNHKPIIITDTLEAVNLPKRFACANEQRKGHFGKFG